MFSWFEQATNSTSDLKMNAFPRTPNAELLSRLLDKNNKKYNATSQISLKASDPSLKDESRVIAAKVAASLYKKSEAGEGQEAQQSSQMNGLEQVVEPKIETWMPSANHVFSSPLRTNNLDCTSETAKSGNSHSLNCSLVSPSVMIKESYACPLHVSLCSYNGCDYQNMCQMCQNNNAVSCGLLTPSPSSSSLASSSCSSVNNLFSHSQDVAAKSKTCLCQRLPQVILCRSCGEVFTGRCRKMCAAHPKQFFLMDFNCCYKCGSQNLKEVCSAEPLQSQVV